MSSERHRRLINETRSIQCNLDSALVRVVDKAAGEVIETIEEILKLCEITITSKGQRTLYDSIHSAIFDTIIVKVKD